jgi:hypothetical protein
LAGGVVLARSKEKKYVGLEKQKRPPSGRLMYLNEGF